MATIINNNANNNKNSSNNNVSSARDNINLSKENSSMLKNTDISDVVKCLQVYNAVLTSFHPSIRKHVSSIMSLLTLTILTIIIIIIIKYSR